MQHVTGLGSSGGWFTLQAGGNRWERGSGGSTSGIELISQSFSEFHNKIPVVNT